MHCPKDQSLLHKKTVNELLVEECSKCGGMWLEFRELDQLEDEVFNDDEMKGTVVYESSPSELKCPQCLKHMKKFFYRLHDELQLEYCPDKHGFWLDKGENEQILTIMNEEKSANERSQQNESSWIKHLYRLQDSNYFDKLLTYLPGIKGE